MLAGTEISSIDRHSEAFTAWGVCYDNGNIPFIDWHLFKQMVEENGSYYSDGWGYRRSASFFGTANYAFKGRYIVNGTMRDEGSNELGRSTKTDGLPI